MEIEHEQVPMAKECKAARLRQDHSGAQAHKDDQEVLGWLEAEEQKLHAQKLQREAEKIDATEMEAALEHLAEQSHEHIMSP